MNSTHPAIQCIKPLSFTLLISLFTAIGLHGLSSCSGTKKWSPEAYHDSLLSVQNTAADWMERRIRVLAETNGKPEAKELDQALLSAREKIQQLPAFEQDSALLLAVDSCIGIYQSIHRRQIPEIERLLHKPRAEFSKADEARLEFLYREISLMSKQSLQHVQNVAKVFRSKYQLSDAQNVPLRP